MSTQITNAYTLLREAGRGTHAKVYTSLPTRAINRARKVLRMGADKDIVTSTLLSRVVALKVSHLHTSSLSNEIRILLAIQQQASLHKGGKLCVQLLDYALSPSLGRSWFTMATTPMCCDLATLCSGLDGALPEPLLWLIITQLFDAFWFLHRVCVPPIAHGDVGLSNVIISYLPSSSPPATPSLASITAITVIDFGTASLLHPHHSKDSVKAKATDVENLCYEIKELILACGEDGEAPEGRGKEGTGKERMSRFLSIWGDVACLEGLWVEIGRFAQGQVNGVGEEEWRGVREVVLNAIAKGEKEGGLRGAVEDMLEL